MSENIGDRIKKLVKERGHNIEWLAAELRISKQSLYKTLNKDSFNTDTLKKISDVLDVPVGFFFMDDVDIAYDILFTKEKDIVRHNKLFTAIMAKTLLAISSLQLGIESKKLSISEVNEELKELKYQIEKILQIRMEAYLKNLSLEERQMVMIEIEQKMSDYKDANRVDYNKLINDLLNESTSNQ